MAQVAEHSTVLEAEELAFRLEIAQFEREIDAYRRGARLDGLKFVRVQLEIQLPVFIAETGQSV
jgi:hypothetical protein